jgi:hypothetical protein
LDVADLIRMHVPRLTRFVRARIAAKSNILVTRPGNWYADFASDVKGSKGAIERYVGVFWR